MAGYLIAAGRFNLAFLAAGVIGLGAPLIVAGWQESSTASPSRARWQEFKAGIGEWLAVAWSLSRVVRKRPNSS